MKTRLDSCDMIFEVNYFLTFSDYWNPNEVTYLDYQERRCFGSRDARSVSWSAMTVFWLGYRPAAPGNKSCRANKDIMGSRSVNQDRPLCPNRWMSRGTRVRVLVTGNDENQKKQLTKKSNHSSCALKISVEQRCERISLDICSVFIDETLYAYYQLIS